MFSFLLKKALPFTLTFVVGAALGSLTGMFRGSGKSAEPALFTRTYEAGRGCRMRRKLVAETRPLAVLYKPVVSFPLGREFADAGAATARVSVTFGADGKVKEVRPLSTRLRGLDESLVRVKAMWEAVEAAARRIEFTPETINGVPVSVTREVEMEFAPTYR